MKITHFLIFIVMTFGSLTQCKAETNEFNSIVSTSDTLKIATYNIRIQTSDDTGNRSWLKRKKYIAKLINTYKPDIFGIQEILNISQQDDLTEKLPAYGFYAKGRDNNEGTKGERLAIFYNKIRFTVENEGYFFLSSTPNVVSIGWDAALNRICLWMKLHDNITDKSFYYFNVHFDHVGTIARAESAKLIVAKINEIDDTVSVFCGGDFNESPFETAVYNTMKTNLSDSKLITETKLTGIDGTFNNWDVTSSTFDENKRIDYLYTKNIRVLTYSVLNDKYVSDAYPSDHFPVFINCMFK